MHTLLYSRDFTLSQVSSQVNSIIYHHYFYYKPRPNLTIIFIWLSFNNEHIQEYQKHEMCRNKMARYDNLTCPHLMKSKDMTSNELFKNLSKLTPRHFIIYNFLQLTPLILYAWLTTSTYYTLWFQCNAFIFPLLIKQDLFIRFNYLSIQALVEYTSSITLYK